MMLLMCGWMQSHDETKHLGRAVFLGRCVCACVSLSKKKHQQ